MKRVILTIGPQGAGKSTFCKAFLKLNPNFQLISRDKILIELFGTTWLDGYSGGHYHAYVVMLERLQEALKPKNCTTILDYWTGYAEERRSLINEIKNICPIDEVYGWFFTTPEDTCVKWFFQKNQQVSISEDGIRSNYKIFHKQPVDLDQGFDFIKKINPLQMDIKI